MSLVATLNSGVSALSTFSKGIQVIANDISNVNTTGYKGAQATYADGFSNMLREAAPSPASGLGSNTQAIQVGTGVRLQSVTNNFEQGTLNTTGGKSDLAIAGEGFFRVRDAANGLEYVTRAGDFRVDDQGYLVTKDGFRVQGLFDGSASFSAVDDNGTLSFVKTDTAPGAVGDIKIDFNVGVGSGITNDTGGAFTDAEIEAAKPTMRSFTIDPLGNVVIGLSNGDTMVAGRVLLQNFRDPGALTRAGNNLFTGLEAAGPMGGVALSATNNSPGTGTLGRVQVGTLELSNVDLSKEFAEMIVVQRSFQAGSRIVTTSDSMLEEIINLKR